MGIKEMVFDNESESGKRFFDSMLKWLDAAPRRKLNNVDELLAGAGMRSGQNVLELGCGSGYFTVPAARLLGDDGRLTSVDLHPAAVEETQRKVEAAGLQNVIVQREDALHTSFEDATFDMVLLYGVIPAPVIPTAKVSREVYRLLKPGGVYAIWTMVPFWKPDEAARAASFRVLETLHGVFRFQKV